MGYLLPRAIIVLIGWGLTCVLIFKIWPEVDPMVFYIAGATWAVAGLVCFRYLYKLRREANPHPNRSFSAGGSAS